jgi:hypothetical protein
VSGPRDARHNSRSRQLRWRRHSSVTSAQYPPSSGLAMVAPRSGI